MPKFLADENFDGRVFREIKRRLANQEIISVYDVQLYRTKDELVLEWAALNGYVLFTHDVNTMPGYAYDRVVKGLVMPGVVVIKRLAPLGRMVTDLELLIECTKQDEWEGHIQFIPF